MTTDYEATLAMFCTALEMKEKKKDLYEEAMNACPDQVGKETFRMLRDAELEHTRHIQETYEELKQGKVWADACKYYPEQQNMQDAFRNIAEQHSKVAKACGDEIYALDTGMSLEQASIQFFEEQLKRASDPLERRFLETMSIDEREHFRMLADLKFYYADPQAWLMEKSKARLDGA